MPAYTKQYLLKGAKILQKKYCHKSFATIHTLDNSFKKKYNRTQMNIYNNEQDIWLHKKH